MKRQIGKYVAAAMVSLGLLFAVSIPASAKNSRTIDFHHDIVLNGTPLQAGQYSIQWETHSPEATVQFLQHHKVVLSTQGKVEQRDRAYDQDAVVYGTAADGSMTVNEIRFARSNQVIVFNQ